MISFLWKGLVRDKSRSLLPLIVVFIGVMLTVFMRGYIHGVMSETLEETAKFNTGHIKCVTKAYAKNMAQMPNDLAFLNVDSFFNELNSAFPELEWEQRIRFGGLLDVADSNGETLFQGSFNGMGIDLHSTHSKDSKRLNLANSLIEGHLPKRRGEILMSEILAQKLHLTKNNDVTFIGSTMNGSMTFYNFKVTGIVRFGNTAMNRNTVIADLSDVQSALDMKEATSEILGFFKSGFYNETNAIKIQKHLESTFFEPDNEFSPTFLRLSNQNGLDLYVYITDYFSWIISLIFIIAMSLVLWNAGLLGGLRRYGEVGLRLAIGEEKTHLYYSMIIESIFIGLIGSILGTAAGLSLSYLLQVYGLDISTFTQSTSSNILLPNIMKSKITASDFYIGLIPGLASTVLGTMLSGIGIFRRETASLFKELET